jgi:hypothetical protein
MPGKIAAQDNRKKRHRLRERLIDVRHFGAAKTESQR